MIFKADLFIYFIDLQSLFTDLLKIKSANLKKIEDLKKIYEC